MRSLSLLLIATLVGCGQPSEPMAGLWLGQMQVTMLEAGAADFTYQAQMYVVVDGKRAIVGGVCPGVSGTIEAQGEGRSWVWVGEHECPLPTKTCATGTLTLHGMAFSVNELGTEALITGRAVLKQCGPSTMADLAMHGHREGADPNYPN